MERIALVDDDQNILTSLEIMLEHNGYEVDTYTDGESALNAFVQSAPDAAILDVTMPRMDGLDLLQKIRKRSSIPVLMLTSRDDDADAAIGLRMGADDYVTKPFSHRVLLERLRACRRRAELQTQDTGVEDPPQVVERGPLVVDPGRYTVTWDGADVRLTRTEFDMLLSLVERPGIVRSRDHLNELIHGEGMRAYDRNVDCHIQRLRRKIRVTDPSFDAIRAVHGLGYKYAVSGDWT